MAKDKQPKGKSAKGQTAAAKGPKRNVKKARKAPKPRRYVSKAIARNSSLGVEITVKSCMYNFLAPCDAHDFRWPFEDSGTVPSSVRTGAAHLKYVSQFTNSAGFAGTYTAGNKATQLFYLFRNPLRSLVLLKTVASPATYNGHFSNGTTSWVPTKNSANLSLPIAFFQASAITNAPHSEFLYSGTLLSAPELCFFWLGTNDAFSIVVSGTGTPDDFLVLSKADTPGQKGCTCSPVGSPTAVTSLTTYTLTATTPGYYALSLASGSTTVTWSYAVSIVVAAGDCLAHLALPQAQTHPEYMKQVRLLSASLLCTNVASKYAKEGTSQGAVISDGSPFYLHNTPEDLQSKSDYYYGPAEKGIYTWLRPGTGAFEYRNAMQVDSTGLVTDTNFALDDGCEYQAVLLRSDVSTGGVYPLDYLVAVHYNVEFHTDDQWREVAYPTFDGAVAIKALQLAVRCTTFSENPLHIAQVKAFVTRVGKLIRAHSKTLGGILSGAFPEYAGIINPAAALLQS